MGCELRGAEQWVEGVRRPGQLGCGAGGGHDTHRRVAQQHRRHQAAAAATAATAAERRRGATQSSSRRPATAHAADDSSRSSSQHRRHVRLCSQLIIHRTESDDAALVVDGAVGCISPSPNASGRGEPPAAARACIRSTNPCSRLPTHTLLTLHLRSAHARLTFPSQHHHTSTHSPPPASLYTQTQQCRRCVHPLPSGLRPPAAAIVAWSSNLCVPLPAPSPGQWTGRGGRRHQRLPAAEAPADERREQSTAHSKRPTRAHTARTHSSHRRCPHNGPAGLAKIG